jgi:hypothetical protein
MFGNAIFQRTLKIFAGILALVCIALVTGVIYYLAIKHSPWDFVFPQAARVMVLNNGIDDPMLPQIYKALPEQFRGIRAVSESLKEIADVHPNLTHILARLQKRVLLVETKDGKGMLIADTGWQSLLLPGGGLAVRSIFNPEGRVRFSASEASTAGIDYILYSISPAREETPFHLAPFGNILLVAEETETIAASIRENRARSKEAGTDWSSLAEAFPLESISLLYAPEFGPLFIPGRARLNLTERGSAAAFHVESQDSVKIALRVFFDSAHGQGAGRVLRSNQYRATTMRALTEDTDSHTTLLFDDIEELVRLVHDMGAGREEITGEERAEMHNWAANELSFFSLKGKSFVSIRAQNARRALTSALERSPDSEPGEENGYIFLRTPLPDFMKVFLPFTPQSTRLGYCVKYNNEFTFGEDSESLRTLIASRGGPQERAVSKDISGFFSEKANFLAYRKGASAILPASASIAEAAGLDTARLISLSRIRMNRGQLQADIHLSAP